jgi:hypothetical protein
MRCEVFGVKFGLWMWIGIATALGACDTPRHSNTLIFGTSTKVALDASQDPSGSMGVTIGYKRHEAVWMPLVANEAASAQSGQGARLIPSACGDDDCRKFVGSTGSGGAAGSGATDTYSVLATFSGQMSAAAQNPQGKAAVAQYFATGIAARLLAQQGGAAVVNGTADPPSALSAQADIIVLSKRQRIATIGAKLSKTTGEINTSNIDKLLQESQGLSDEDKTAIKAQISRKDLEDHLLAAPEAIADRLYEALDKL